MNEDKYVITYKYNEDRSFIEVLREIIEVYLNGKGK